MKQRGRARLLLPSTVNLPTRPSLPSLGGLGGVRSLNDLKRELAAVGAASSIPKINLRLKELRKRKAATGAKAAVAGDGAETEAAAQGGTPVVPENAPASRAGSDELSAARDPPVDTVAVDDPSTRSGEVSNTIPEVPVADARTDKKTAGGSPVSMPLGTKRSRSRSSDSTSTNKAGESGEALPGGGGGGSTGGRYPGSGTTVGPEGQVEISPRVTGSVETGNGEELSQQQQQRVSSSLVALSAVANFDEQVQGLGVRSVQAGTWDRSVEGKML